MHTAQSMLVYTLEAESLKCAALKHSAKTNNDRFLKKERERENSLRYVWKCFATNYNAFPHCLMFGNFFKIFMIRAKTVTFEVKLTQERKELKFCFDFEHPFSMK